MDGGSAKPPICKIGVFLGFCILSVYLRILYYLSTFLTDILMKNSFYKRILYMFLGSKFDSTKPPNCRVKGGVGEPVFIQLNI